MIIIIHITISEWVQRVRAPVGGNSCVAFHQLLLLHPPMPHPHTNYSIGHPSPHQKKSPFFRNSLLWTPSLSPSPLLLNLMFHVPCFKTAEEINFFFNIIPDYFSISTSLSLSLSQSGNEKKTWQSPLQNLKGRRAVWDASSLWLTKYEDLIRAIHTFHNIQFSGRAKPL